MAHLSIRLDARTQERLAAIVKVLGERGPEPNASQAVRHAIDRLYAELCPDDGSDDAGGSASDREGERA
jgi:hypothetical protein